MVVEKTDINVKLWYAKLTGEGWEIPQSLRYLYRANVNAYSHRTYQKQLGSKLHLTGS